MGGTNSLWVSAGPPRLRPHSAWCLTRLPCGPFSPSPPVILHLVTRNEKTGSEGETRLLFELVLHCNLLCKQALG